MERLLVGGYFDERIFKGDYFDGKTPFDKDIDTYTVDEALKLGFVENVVENYEDMKEDNDKEWDDLSNLEKIEEIIKYVQYDEVAGICYFKTEEEAEQYKNEVLKEISDIENQIENREIIHLGNEQDEYGKYKEVYSLRD